MKKFVKSCLAAIGIMAAVGGVFCITGFAMGGGTLGIFTEGWQRTAYDEAEECFYAGGKKVDADFEESFDGVENLSIEVKNAELKIVEGEENACIVKAANTKEDFQCYVKDGTLILRREIKGGNWINLNKKAACIVLEIPKKKDFDRVELSVGVGDLNFKKASAKQLFIDCGIGSVVYDGKVDGDVDITCGVGEVELSLSGKSRDFNYSVNCGIGEVRIGGTSFSGIFSDRNIDNHGEKEISLECGIGSVGIDFPEEGDLMEEALTEENIPEMEETRLKDKKRYVRRARVYEEKAVHYEEKMDAYREKAEYYWEKGQDEKAAEYEEKAAGAGEKRSEAQARADGYWFLADGQEEKA